jgi:two-component system sensor histidine kinase LytS
MPMLTWMEDIRPILNLFLSLAEHFGLISAAAFILLSSRTLQRMTSGDLTLKDKLAMILFFGVFGIFGTYQGDAVQGVIANLRAISMILAGLLGGPVVGIGAGLIAGGHRWLIDLGGLSALPCGLATFLEGTLAGLVALRQKEDVLNWRVAFLLGIVGESMHMGLILVMSHPFETAFSVVKLIGIPMILLNSIGAACLVQMLRKVERNRELRASIQARKAMTIANRTVIHLQEGLDEASAQATAEIIHDETQVSAVAITDDRLLLAFIGAGAEFHKIGQAVSTRTTMRVLETGKPIFVKGHTAVGENVPHSLFKSAIVVPLKKSKHVIGTLKFYGDKKHPLNPIDFEIATGLADLFSTQLELEDIQIKAQLLARAEIKRLQDQINPHFLFNSLNTIASFCRSNSHRARQLLLELATYLRRNIQDKREYIPLCDEMEQVQSYLAIEHARFGDRIRFEMAIEPLAEQWPVPPLIVQPLVENAVKHGLSGKEEGGKIWVHATRDNGDLRIRVKDDGQGMSAAAIEKVFAVDGPKHETPGLGLRNVNQRLEHIYGPPYRIQIHSQPQQGTLITLHLPFIQAVTEEPRQAVNG